MNKTASQRKAVWVGQSVRLSLALAFFQARMRGPIAGFPDRRQTAVVRHLLFV